MATFFAIPTLAGQAAVAAALDGGDPIVLSEMVVGDGNGNPVTPLETQTSLVNPCATVPITAKTHVDNKLTVDALLDHEVGGFTIREAGILDEDGVLLFVGMVPATEKRLVSEGVEHLLTLGMIIVVSDTANVTLSVTGSTYASHDYVNDQIGAIRTTIATPLRVYNIAVKSLSLAAPPVAPTPGDVYVVATDATGLWAGQTGKLAQYVSAGVGWQFVTPPVAHVVSDEATGLQYQRAAGGTYGVIIPANPGAARAWLHEEVVGGTRAKGWSDPFDINGQTTRTIALNDFIAFHDVSVGGKSKATVRSLAESVAEIVALSDYNHSESYFLGMM